MIRVLQVVGVVLLVGLVLLRLTQVGYGLFHIFWVSGYPWWIQAPAVLALFGGFFYLFRTRAFTRRDRFRWWW